MMFEQIGVDRNWVPGTLERPLDRGVNFLVTVPAIIPLVERLSSCGWPLFMAPENKWYPTGDTEAGVSQFLVQDLLRRDWPPTNAATASWPNASPMTAKIDGKTVTKRLTPAEAELYQEWIGNDRQLRAMIAQMREVAAKATELILKANARHGG